MGLNSRGATHPKMIQSAADVLSGFESCEIEIVDPNTNSGNDNFNVWTNETGSEPNVVWSGSAQMQVFRQTLTLEIPAGGMTQVRSARFTISDEVAPYVPGGFIVRVTAVDSNRNADAMNYQYTVTSGIRAPHAFTTTLECEVDMRVKVT